MQSASFKISNYKFTKTLLDFSFYKEGEIDVSFAVSGTFIKSRSIFELRFAIIAKSEGITEAFVSVDCESIFEFTNVSSLAEVPDYFYTNCIAILFPYLRAYVSTITVQSNIRPIILPTLNLSDLNEPLKQHTNEID
ncbi:MULTISPECIES: protein-export chaperone SecB [Sphingobacterium]|uniref:protein-export chaperone SecB n=1 Tax=Sphingobacterium TaxID=28453 RepID=UPI0010503811|nr:MULTISPECIES: protein-export chaperone SecB [Sphingobacterium]MCW2262094.1 preprotein translocase subunit SecB [Sphingobacterium kitahiroshimense]TCR13159.1 preprotein translocase subunit SecB [Sphingobacterium sp. JUb78]